MQDVNRPDGNIQGDLTEDGLLYYRNHLQVLYKAWADEHLFIDFCKMQVKNKQFLLLEFFILLRSYVFYINLPPVRTAMAK